jgi:hypothetical protein
MSAITSRENVIRNHQALLDAFRSCMYDYGIWNGFTRFRYSITIKICLMAILNGNLTSQSCQSLPLCQIKLLLTKKVRIYSITSKDGVSNQFQLKTSILTLK